MTKQTPKLFFENIIPAWKAACKSGGESTLRIFSPFLTGDIASELAENMSDVEVYTRFDVQLFASGSSNIDSLRRLHEMGVTIYRLRQLHAKVVWIPDEYISIGSQNLTRNGALNKEASVELVSKTQLSKAEKELSKWISGREIIDSEMLDDMERESASLTNVYAEFRRRAEESNIALTQENKKRHEHRISTFAASFENVALSDEIAFKVDLYNSGDMRGHIVALQQRSFLRWTVSEKLVQLKKRRRYLLIVPKEGRVGWIRVNEKNISYFSRRIRRQFTLLGEKCSLRLRAVEGRAYNCTAVVEGHTTVPDCTILLTLDGERLRLHEADKTDRTIRRHWSEISKDLWQAFTTPVNYGEGGKLKGEEAHTFLGANWGERFSMRLAAVEGAYLLIAVRQ